MPAERISDHCSLMAHPERTVRPDDCPPGAAYIKSTRSGGEFELPANAPFPLVFDGGDGDDKVTVVGQGDKLILVSGGKGNDSLVVRGAGHGEGGGKLAVGEHRDGPSGNGKGQASEGLLAAEAPAWTVADMPVEAVLLLAAFLITLATVGTLGWRALAGSRGSPRRE